MAVEVYSFEVTVPAGTAKASPQTSDLTMPPRVVETITIKVPPGPNGTVGFAFGLAGQAIIPVNAGQWIVTDDQTITWTLTDQPDSGAWQCMTYNTGNFDHTLYITFTTDVPAAAKGGALTPTLAVAGMTSND